MTHRQKLSDATCTALQLRIFGKMFHARLGKGAASISSLDAACLIMA
jgi:hypothetical protein